MRQIRRLLLSQDSLGFLRKRTAMVEGKPTAERAVEAARLWKLQGKAFLEIREALGRMASGLKRCMYCEDSRGIAIEHFWPKRDYPHKAFAWTNYLLACTVCNSNYKRTLFPLDRGQPLLLNPTDPAENPLDHLGFSPSTGQFVPLSEKGRASRDVYGLDRDELTTGRKTHWTVLKALLFNYSRHRAAGDLAEAERQKEAVRLLQFSGVFAAFLRIAKGSGARVLIGEEHLQILRNHPEIEDWL
jgi:hypothetical protein